MKEARNHYSFFFSINKVSAQKNYSNVTVSYKRSLTNLHPLTCTVQNKKYTSTKTLKQIGKKSSLHLSPPPPPITPCKPGKATSPHHRRIELIMTLNPSFNLPSPLPSLAPHPSSLVLPLSPFTKPVLGSSQENTPNPSPSGQRQGVASSIQYLLPHRLLIPLPSSPTSA